MEFEKNINAIDRIDAIIVDDYNTQESRDYLGMSAIGGSCEHKLWYGLNWADDNNFDVATVRRFQSGHDGEAYLISQFEKADIGFEAFAPDGKQYRFEDFGGLYGGSCDGIAYRLPPWDVPAIFEAKIVNEKSFRELKQLVKSHEPTALFEWNQTYYGQAMSYCFYAGIGLHWLVVATPGCREIQQVITELDETVAKNLKSRAARIITSRDVSKLTKISNSASWYECKHMCSFTEVCHYGKQLKASCRTCQHGSFDIDTGSFNCSYHGETVSVDRQRIGCDKYLVIQGL